MTKAIRFILLAVVCISLHSCSSYRSTNQAPEEVYATIADESIEMELVYVGTTPNYHIIECTLLNKGESDHTLDRFNFEMINVKKKVSLPALDPYEAELLLNREQKKIKKEKKVNLIGGLVLTGLSAVANAGAGASVAQNIFLTAESAIYIADDSRYYNRNIKSIEDEKLYIAEMVLDQFIVAPRSRITKDLLFPVEKMRGPVEIIYKSAEVDYIFEFSASDFNPR